MKQIFQFLLTIEVVRFWLRSLLFQDIDVMIGDIHEHYLTRMLPKVGDRRAKMWLAWTLVTSVTILLGHRILRILMTKPTSRSDEQRPQDCVAHATPRG